MEKEMRSTFKDDFQGKVEEPVDKVYFRRRDEASMYAEAYFKNKIMVGKKWSVHIILDALLSLRKRLLIVPDKVFIVNFLFMTRVF